MTGWLIASEPIRPNLYFLTSKWNDPSDELAGQVRVSYCHIRVTHGLLSCSTFFKHLESRTQFGSSLNRSGPGLPNQQSWILSPRPLGLPCV